MSSHPDLEAPPAKPKQDAKLRLIQGQKAEQSSPVIDKGKRPTINQLRAFTLPPWFSRLVRLAPPTQPWPSIAGENTAANTVADDAATTESAISGFEAPTQLEPPALAPPPRNVRWLLWLAIGAVAAIVGLLVLPALLTERGPSPSAALPAQDQKQDSVKSATATAQTRSTALKPETVPQPSSPSALEPASSAGTRPNRQPGNVRSSTTTRTARPSKGVTDTPPQAVEAAPPATDVGPSF